MFTITEGLTDLFFTPLILQGDQSVNLEDTERKSAINPFV